MNSAPDQKPDDQLLDTQQVKPEAKAQPLKFPKRPIMSQNEKFNTILEKQMSVIDIDFGNDVS